MKLLNVEIYNGSVDDVSILIITLFLHFRSVSRSYSSALFTFLNFLLSIQSISFKMFFNLSVFLSSVINISLLSTTYLSSTSNASPTPNALIARAGKNPPYPSGPFSSEFAIGGAGGSNFISTSQYKENGVWKLTGNVVQKLGVWTNGKALKAISVTYTDGNSAMFGKKGGDYKEFIFATGEAINSLQLWGNGQGTRTGRVEFTTNKQRSFAHGKDVSGQTGFPQPNLGSGILMGLVGRAGDEIDALGFVFLKKVRSVRITDVNYLTDFNTAATFTDVTLREVDLPADFNWQCSGSETREEVTNWSQTASLTFGTTATISAGLPGMVGVERDFSFQISGSTTKGGEVRKSVTLSWSLGPKDLTKPANPGDRVVCRALTKVGELDDVEFESTVVITLEDTNEAPISYKEKGRLGRTQYSKARADLQVISG